MLALLLSACAAGPPASPDRPPAAGPTGGAAFEVGRDTFAFPNLVRAHHPEQDVGFANYCIIMARAVNQFFRFARFAPDEPVLPADAYTARVRELLALSPRAAPRPAAARIVIPGYPDLHTFSRAQEPAIKAAFGSSLLSMLHWRTWRVALPLPPGHQGRLARELQAELDAGRPAPLMITNFPDPDVLNHAVLVYGYRARAPVVEFLAYDPNDPGSPLGLHFEARTGAFWVEALPYSPAGRIRAFRLFASPLL